jgi:hypothetical protein
MGPVKIVKNIFFSTNETFALILTSTNVSLIVVGPDEIKLVMKFDLPPCQFEVGEEPQWIGAVNNTGTKIALHCTSDFKIVFKHVTFEKPNSGEFVKSKIKIIKNPVWFWSVDVKSFEAVDMGTVCGDEIMEINFELEDKQLSSIDKKPEVE